MQQQQTSTVVVLVVEDEPLVRANAVEALTDDGFEVIEAGDGPEALAVVDAGRRVDVLFTDVNMPGEPDGLALAERVCERRPEVRVIVASGRPLPTVALPCGGQFLPKPYRLNEVSRLVATLMGRPC